ncbi:MAG: DUF1552 domain-containing protein [Myxococcales bacterium]|nr:MAG: DUF1552 domain-containing protein [Myxococcales bacterium]
MTLRNSGRRAFLRGVGGLALGLPLLEYTHEKAWAQTLGRARRLVVVFNHGGETMCMQKSGLRAGNPKVPDYDPAMPQIDHWLPKPGSTFGVAHEIFEGTDLESKLTVIRGLDNAAARKGRYGGDHGLSNTTSLTARASGCEDGASASGDKCPGGDEAETATGASIDWVAAQRLQKTQGGPSNPLALFVPGHYYGSGFFWGEKGEQRTEGEINPRTAWNALFAGVTSGEPDPEAVLRRELKVSMLNSVMDGYKRFSGKLGQADKRILDAHFDHLSSLEREISGLELSAQCVVPGQPADLEDGGQQEKLAPLHAQLIVAALRCGACNVANLQIADILTPWAPSGLQLESAYDIGHSLGHWVSDLGDPANVPRWELEMKENRAWRMGLVKIIADGLNSPDFLEDGAPLLDNSLIFYSNEFSTGGIHSSTDGPYMLLGGAGGYLKTGRFVELHKERLKNPASLEAGSSASTNDLYITLLNALGAADTEFGDMQFAYRKGPITELLA